MEITPQIKVEIRKAYFSGKLNKYLDAISADHEISPEEVTTITDYLGELEIEKTKNQGITKFFDGSIEPPSADQLFNPSDEERQRLKEFVGKCEKTMKVIRDIIDETRKAIINKNVIKRNEWLDKGLSVVALMYTVDQYEIVHEQLYRYELTKIIDTYHVSRIEADERARLTAEYRHYKEAVRLKEQIIEFELLAKRYAGLE